MIKTGDNIQEVSPSTSTSPTIWRPESPSRWTGILPFFFGAVVLVGLTLSSHFNYLLFHSLVELFSVAIAWSVFALAWSTRRYHHLDGGYLLLLGLASLFIGGLDLMHTLVFKGMNVLPDSGSNLSTQLWIAARYLQGLSLLAASALLFATPPGGGICRTNTPHLLFAGYSIITTLLLGAIFGGLFPTCYVEGVGQTLFKRGSECAVCLILLTAALLLWRRRARFDRDVLRWLLAFLAAIFTAEIVFIFYVGVYDLSHMVGHLLKIVASYALYQAIILTGVQKPYALLFRDLHESKEKFKAIADYAASWETWFSPEGKLLWMNPASIKITGYTPEEYLASPNPLSMIIDRADQAVVEEKFQGALRGSSGEGLEVRSLRKNGSSFWISVCWQPILDASGRSLGFRASAYDITKRKQAEKALQVSEKKYHDLFESSRDAIMTLEPPSWKFTSGNPSTLRMFGVKTEEDFLALGPWELSPEQQPDGRASLEKAREMIETTMREGFHFFEWTHRRIGGQEFPANVLLSRMEQNGKVVIQATVRDITENKRAEEEQKRLSTAIEQAAETVVITDPQGTILYANPSFEKTTGYTRSEAIGQNPRILRSGRHDTAFYKDLWQTLTQGKTWSGHFINKKKDGTLYEEEATISPVLDSSGKIINYVAGKRDVTQEVETRQQLFHAQKMEVVGRLAGGVAHDFNNLLMVIGGYTTLLMKNLSSESPGHRMVAEIRKAAERGSTLTRQLLTFGHKQVIQPRLIHLHETVGETAEMLRRILGEEIRVVRNFVPDLVPVMADPGQIQQALINLLLNARDAMPGGGTLTLETSNVELPSARSKDFPGVPRGKYALLAIRDTGSGMTPEVQSHLFEPFFTTKEKGKGTGLGLSTVYGIVKQADGHVTVQSGVGEGTTFRILLPAAQETPSAASVTPADHRRPIGGTETLLLVEDEDALRHVIAQILESAGYRVIQANGAEEALRACHDTKTPIHLILSDVMMPGMKGPDLAREALLLRPTLKVILMSGYSEDQIMNQILTWKDLAFLQKPIPHEKLLGKLREVLDRN